MYLSQLLLNPFGADARKDLSNPYELHRSIMSGFPNPIDPDERVLFRSELAFRSGRFAEVLVQSVFQPDWSEMIKRENYLAGEPVIKSIGEIRLEEGQILAFRLRANPTKRDAALHKRVGLVKWKERFDWLQRKGEQGGFFVLEGSLNIRESLLEGFKVHSKAHRSNAGQPVKMTVHMVDFDGFLEVRDPQRLMDQWIGGIGPAKGLGCGLLSLAPAR